MTRLGGAPGRGGVRIEDTLVVASKTQWTSHTAGETPELLTRFPKELAILA